MNARPYWHLAWKEYRAIRAFWLALVGMVALAEWLAITINHSPSAVTWVFNLALAAPAFFAVGAAGIAFAIEREEGTLDFLRAVPVSAKQVLVAKLGVATVATLAMYLLLWPMALFFTNHRLPESASLADMLALWIIAAFEAIAWGTFFSLFSARPMLAICMAIFGVSTLSPLLTGIMLFAIFFAQDLFGIPIVGHLLEWGFLRQPGSFYSGAALFRTVIALLLIAIDIYLGLRWLHCGARTKRIAWRFSLRRPVACTILEANAETNAKKLLVAQDRSAMLGHLLWQHWRQSRWLMLSLASMWVVVALAIGLQFQFSWSPEADHILTGTIIAGAALLGCFVFRPDQESRHYRFFVEHNVPPRYVWLTRQVPWIATSLIATLVICILRVGPAELSRLWQMLEFQFGTRSRALVWRNLYGGDRSNFDLSPQALILAYAAVSYAAGQWVSMLFRSGIIAAVIGVVLSAVLCGWVLLMDMMHVNWLWSVVPIPLALIGATWLRSPDWIGESRRWSARGRVAAAVFLPAAALLIAVPVYRVHQIAVVATGLDIGESIPPGVSVELPKYQGITNEARATGDLYRRASELYVSHAKLFGPEFYEPFVWEQLNQPLADTERQWLHVNAKSLALVLDASHRPSCAFYDPRTANDPVTLLHDSGLIGLVIANGRQVEAEGKLDEALDRYFSALRVDGHLNELGVSYARVDDAGRVFSQIANWAAQKGQSAERIDAALNRLQGVDESILHLNENLVRSHILARRLVRGDESAMFHEDPTYINKTNSTESEFLWGRLMPWERERGVRMLNQLTATALDRLQSMRHVMDMQVERGFWQDRRRQIAQQGGRVGGVVDYVVPSNAPTNLADVFSTSYHDLESTEETVKADWLRTTHPDLTHVGYRGIASASALAEFETWRRATMVRLAIESHRLKHGALPQSLAELVGPYFSEMPLDPYSGLEFRYFPAGLPPSAESTIMQYDIHPIVPGVPCIWSTGPNLWVEQRRPDSEDSATKGPAKNVEPILYYYLRHPEVYRQIDVPVWARGFWFPILDQRH